MRLDEDTWDALLEICAREGETQHSILGLIQQSRASDESLTNATRRFTLNYFRRGFAATLLSSLQPLRPELITRLADGMPHAVVRRTVQEAGDDYEQKIQLTLPSIEALEEGGMPRRWAQWRGLRGGAGGIPSFDDFAQGCSPPIAEDDSLNVIDVEPDNPFLFRGVQIHSGVAGLTGRNLSGNVIGEFPFGIHAQGMQTDFNVAKMSGQPVYHVIRQRFDDYVRTYSRLILPFTADGSDGSPVIRLVTVVRRIEPIHSLSGRRSKRPLRPSERRTRRA